MANTNTFNSTSAYPPREAFLAGEELPLALVVVIHDPETDEERQLTIPLSLLTKLWPRGSWSPGC
jgi:hypothetical protein